MKKGNAVLFKVFLAIILAVIAGSITNADTELFGVSVIQLYQLIGQLFLNALSLVVVPLVCASIITGSAKMGSEQSFGKLGAKTFAFFLGTSALAILIGITFTLLIGPGEGQSALATVAKTAEPVAKLVDTGQDGFDKIAQLFYKLIPSNIISAASQGQMLGLIIFSLFFGYFITKVDKDSGAIMLGFWKALFQIMMKITQVVMLAMPIGVFGLVAKVVATTGFEAFSSLTLFTLTIFASLLTYALVALPFLLIFVGRINPFTHYRAVGPALFTAFSTSSSAAAFPFTLECMEKRAGISNRICSFTLPLGASMCMAGSALYQCAAALFIAQVYGIDLSLTTVTLVAIMSLMMSVGVAGIPSACLISIVIILNTIGVPAEGIGLLIAVERILDMCRTTVNVLGNTCCTAMIARSETEPVMTQPVTLQKANG